MSEHWSIRTYRPGDGDRLRELWTVAGFRLIGDDDAGLDRFAARNPGLFLVVEDGLALMGSAMGAWDGRRGWIYHVTVAPRYRRRGLATDLVRRVEAGLRECGCQRVLVIVESANEPALRFWTALGYEIRDTRHLARAL